MTSQLLYMVGKKLKFPENLTCFELELSTFSVESGCKLPLRDLAIGAVCKPPFSFNFEIFCISGYLHFK